MNDFLSDPTVRVYIFDLIVALYGTGLFFWWWIKQGKASSMYAYVSFLFFGEIIEVGMMLYASGLRYFSTMEEYQVFLSAPLWALRKVVTLAAFIFIVVHMSYRAFCNPAYRRRREDL